MSLSQEMSNSSESKREQMKNTIADSHKSIEEIVVKTKAIAKEIATMERKKDEVSPLFSFFESCVMSFYFCSLDFALKKY